MLHNFVGDMDSRFDLESRVAQALCHIIDTPRSLTVALLLKYGEYQQYMDLSINPGWYQDVGNFADDYLVTEVLKKSPNIPLDIDRQKVALDSFWESEARCKETNDRMLTSDHPPWMLALQHNIARILGPLTRDDVDSVDNSMRFGPGATTGVSGKGAVTSDKYDATLHLTHELIPFVRSILGERWWQHQRKPHSVVEGNKFATVPKNAKTNRGICIEPTLNIYVQLGQGALLRKRLRKIGVDLSSQERNQALAKRA